MIKFTIVTCTYNAEAVLQRTLDSVMKQTYCNIEHLIIDGVSKDKTLTMVKAYQHKNDVGESAHAILVFSEPDKGLYDAMNKGIDRATGDYLIFLNAGDVFPSEDTLEFVEGCVGEGEELPGVLYGDTDIVNMDGHFLRHRRLTPPKRLSWRSFMWGMLVCHQSFYARADIAKGIHYNLDYRFSADVDWCIRIMRESARRHLPLRNVNAVITNYLDGGMSVQNHKASLKERFQVMRSHYGLLTTLFVHAWFVVRGVFKK
nr:glycosyltransferase family 2 protein [uncultured Prevotella sp.]